MNNKLYNIAAEQLVLGTILVYQNRMDDAAELITSNMFYDNTNSEIFGYMQQLYNENKTIDPVNIYSKSNNTVDIAYLTKLSAASVNNKLEEYCEIIKEKHKLRFIRQGLVSSLEKLDGGETSDNIINCQNDVILQADGDNKDDMSDINEIIISTLDRIDFNVKNKGKLTGMETGLNDLDYLTNGLQAGLHIIAGRPAMGKTAVCTNILKNAVCKGNVGIMFSLEMSKEQLMQRILSCTANVEMEKIIKGNLSDGEMSSIMEANTALAKTKLFVDDNPLLNTIKLRAKCKKIKKKHGLDFIIIDYLQLMEGDSKLEHNANRQIGKITRELKILSKEMDIPVILLSQLSRGCEQRVDKRPIMSDLRESGAIEQDADMVMFLYRDEYYNEESEKKGIIELLVKKHRQGECKTVELACMLEYQKIANLARPQNY